jgi:hypothetical protein
MGLVRGRGYSPNTTLQKTSVPTLDSRVLLTFDPIEPNALNFIRFGVG